jgi:hypothetical protein
MPPQAHITHQIPGRLRLRVPSRIRNTGYFAGLAGALSRYGGVRSVTTNPVTGSVLIVHESDAAAIFDQAQREQLLALAPPETREVLARRVSEAVTKADQGVTAFTRGSLDLPSLGFLAFLAAGSAQLFRNRIWPPAITLFWYALSLARGK